MIRPIVVMYLNHGTITCNIFKLLNVVIGLMITFKLFLFKSCDFNVLYLQKKQEIRLLQHCYQFIEFVTD